MRRRAMLRQIGAIAIGVSAAGCQQIATSPTASAHAMDVENYSNRSHEFEIRVRDDEDNAEFAWTGSVTPQALVSKDFQGRPATIHVRVGDGPVDVFDWPALDCDDHGPAPKVEVEYGAGTNMNNTRIQAHCEPGASDP